jgi:hypothetical protein
METPGREAEPRKEREWGPKAVLTCSSVDGPCCPQQTLDRYTDE